MKYNCSIENMDALPIPYAVYNNADNVQVGNLFKGQPLFVLMNYITGSHDERCVRVSCQINNKPAILTIRVSPSLNIKFIEESAPRNVKD